MTAAGPALDALEIRSAEVEVYEALRTGIVRGTLPGGTVLRLAQLADRFRVSTMPVRAAITRLQSEGLVTQQPRRGATVTQPNADDFRDLYAIREGLEGAAARLGSPQLRDDGIDAMRVSHQQMADIASSGEDAADRYVEQDRHMHDICYRAAGRTQLVHLITVYRRNAERYFRLYLDTNSWPADELELQELFVSACSRRNGKRAEAAMRTLFEHTADRVLAQLTNGGADV